MPRYARALNWIDEMPQRGSEAHYVFMEAGTNQFDDHVFTTGDDPSPDNSTNSTAHLVTQIRARHDLDWMSYQEGISKKSGACPVVSDGNYVARHNPFVFFTDVVGNPPARDNSYCGAHHKSLEGLAVDLADGKIPAYAFITPNLCNDMHGGIGCPGDNFIMLGDRWLDRHLPPLIDWADKHAGVIFITWDEGAKSNKLPFLAIGPSVKSGYAGRAEYDHGSLLKTVETIFGLPFLKTVESKQDLRDLFKSGQYP
jgi:hypothetical protein